MSGEVTLLARTLDVGIVRTKNYRTCEGQTLRWTLKGPKATHAFLMTTEDASLRMRPPPAAPLSSAEAIRPEALRPRLSAGLPLHIVKLVRLDF